MTLRGDGATSRGIETILDAGELNDELVDRGVDIDIVSLCLPSFEIDGLDGGPEALSVSPGVGEGSCYANRPDGIELVSVVEYLGFKGGWLRIGAKAMSRDGVGHGLHGHRGIASQDVSGSPSGNRRMVEASRLCLSATSVMEQHGCSHDTTVSTLGFRNALRNLQDAENMVEVVHSVFAIVEAPCFSDRDHTNVSDVLELLAQFLINREKLVSLIHISAREQPGEMIILEHRKRVEA